MTQNTLPDISILLRYVRSRMILDNGRPDGSAFILGSDEQELSVNWLDYFTGKPKAEQVQRVREVIQLNLGKKDRLAECNVGAVKQTGALRNHTLNLIHSPSLPLGEYGPDPSHALVYGLPPTDDDEAALVGDMIALCVTEMHPAG